MLWKQSIRFSFNIEKPWAMLVKKEGGVRAVFRRSMKISAQGALDLNNIYKGAGLGR